MNCDQRQSDMSATTWGTSRLRNAGGTRVKRWTGGIAAGGDVHHFFGTLKGTGGYAGLVAHGSAWVAESGEGFTSDLEIVEAGWIETTDGNTVPPAPGPGTTPANWTPVVGIATLTETAYDGSGPFVLDVEQSDRTRERAAGKLLRGDRTEQPDGSIDYLAQYHNLREPRTAPGSPPPRPPAMVRGPGPVFEHFQYGPVGGLRRLRGAHVSRLFVLPGTRSRSCPATRSCVRAGSRRRSNTGQGWSGSAAVAAAGLSRPCSRSPTRSSRRRQ